MGNFWRRVYNPATTLENSLPGTPACDGAAREYAAWRPAGPVFPLRAQYRTHPRGPSPRCCGPAPSVGWPFCLCDDRFVAFSLARGLSSRESLTTLMAGILLFKAREALTRDPATEMWLYLEKDVRPPEAYAQWASSVVLRETYLTFAKWTSSCHGHLGLGAAVLFHRHMTVIFRHRAGHRRSMEGSRSQRPSANTGIMSRKIVQGVIGRSLQCSSLVRRFADRRLIDRERSESHQHIRDDRSGMPPSCQCR